MSEYITKSGDTFDIVALNLFGNEKLAVEIIKENINYCDVIIFSAGVKLKIPKIEYTNTDNEAIVPEWR